MRPLFRIVAALVLFCQSGVAKSDVIVPHNSQWKWLHPTDSVDPAKADQDFHTTFFKADFDDSAWKKGRDQKGPHGGFAYGEKEFQGVDLGVPAVASDRRAAYFRLKFTTKTEFKKLIFKCQRDDGIIVYIDGKEVVRDNVGKGKEAYDLFAVETTSSTDETTVNSYELENGLPAGDHILAISLHNRPGPSSDMRIAEISLEVDYSGMPLIRKAPAIDPDLITLIASDGSTIVGKLDVTEIQLMTSYGTLTIPIQKILSLTPGLNSRPSLDDGIQLLIDKIGSLKYNERELARRGLTDLGMAVRAEIVRALATAKDPHRIRELNSILENIEQQVIEAEEEATTVQVGLVRPDTVVTSKFTATGTISPRQFKIQSKFGQLTVRLADIRKAIRPLQRAIEITKSVTVSGKYVVQKKSLNTDINVERGDRITIRASGQLTMTPWGSTSRSTPDGNASQFGQYRPGIPSGALMGKIGTGGKPFKIGSKHTFTATRSGTLYLAIGMSASQASSNFPGSYQAKIHLKRD